MCTCSGCGDEHKKRHKPNPEMDDETKNKIDLLLERAYNLARREMVNQLIELRTHMPLDEEKPVGADIAGDWPDKWDDDSVVRLEKLRRDIVYYAARRGDIIHYKAESFEDIAAIAKHNLLPGLAELVTPVEEQLAKIAAHLEQKCKASLREAVELVNHYDEIASAVRSARNCINRHVDTNALTTRTQNAGSVVATAAAHVAEHGMAEPRALSREKDARAEILKCLDAAFALVPYTE